MTRFNHLPSEHFPGDCAECGERFPCKGAYREGYAERPTLESLAAAIAALTIRIEALEHPEMPALRVAADLDGGQL